MGSYIDGLVEALKKSVTPIFWLYFALVSIATAVVSIIIFIVFAIIGIFWASSILGVNLVELFIDSTASQALENPSSVAQISALIGALANPAVVTNLALAIFVLVAALLIVSTLVESFFGGIFFNLARGFLHSGKCDFGSALDKSKKRFLVLFKAKIIVGLLLAVLTLIVFSPVLFSVLSLVQQVQASPMMLVAEPGSLVSLVFVTIFLFALLFLALVLILFFILPYLAMVAPVVLFEDNGVIDSIKRAIEIVKGKYVSSLGYLFLLFLITMAVLFAYIALASVLNLISNLLVLSLIGNLVIVLFFAILIIRIVFDFIFNIWIFGFNTLASVTLYELNSGSSAGSKRKKSGFVGARAR